MIERLLTPGSILEQAMRRYVHGKDTLRLFPIGAKQSTRCGDPVSQKTCKQNQKRALRWCG